METNNKGNKEFQELHTQLVKDNYAIPEKYEDFESTFSNPADLKNLYDQLIKDNYALPQTFDEFTNIFGLKKKETPADYGLPSKDALSRMFENVSVEEEPQKPEEQGAPVSKPTDIEKNPLEFSVPDLSLKTPEATGYPRGLFVNAVGQSIKRINDAENYKKAVKERISEIDKELVKLPKVKAGEYVSPLPSAGPSIGQEIITDEEQKLRDEKAKLQYAITKPDQLTYILGKAYNNSLVGLADNILSGEAKAPEDWLTKYDASTMTDVAATALGFLFDSPVFSGLGAAGAKVVQPIVKNVMKKSVTKFVKAGIEQSLAEKLAMKGAQKLALSLPTMASSGTALGGYGLITDALSQWADPEKDFKDIDFSQSLSRGMKDFVLGVGVGTLGLGTSAIAQKAKAIPSTAGRIGTQAAIQAGGLTAESALFTGGGALLEGKGLKDIGEEDFLSTVMLLGTLKISNIIQKPGESLRGIYKSAKFDNNKPGQGIYSVDVFPWEIESLGAKDYKGLIKDLSDDKKLADFLQNKDVPALLKQKLLWGSRGVGLDDVSLYADQVKPNGDFVDLINKEGMLVDRRKYSDKDMANQAAVEMGLQLEDNKMQMNSALPEVDRIKLLTQYKNKGGDIMKLLSALDKPVAGRTPEESKIVGDWFSMIPKPEEKNAEETLAIGDRVFLDEKDLTAYLENVAIDKETGQIDKRWFDREVNAWPSPKTILAINKWTDAKKAEIKAREDAEESQVEKEKPVKPEVATKVQKEFDKNGLIDEIRRYNDMTASEKKKNASVLNNIKVNAQRLKYDVDEKGENIKLKQDGKIVKKTPIKVDKEKIEKQKLLSEMEPDFQQYVNDVLETNPDLYGVMIQGLSNEQRAKAFKDIKEGNKTAVSATALSELQRMYKEHGGIDVWNAEGKAKVSISREEILAEKADLIRRKRAELDNYSYLDGDILLEKGLITKDEYDEITEFIRKEGLESERTQEDYDVESSGNDQSSKEKGTEESGSKVETPKKEPWQMTKQDFAYSPLRFDDMPLATGKGVFKVKENSDGTWDAWSEYDSGVKDYWVRNGSATVAWDGGRRETSYMNEKANAKSLSRHYDAVRDAVLQGKDVPKEVLEDYADLQTGSKYSIEQKKKVDAINKEYDAKSADLKKELGKMTDEARNKIIQKASKETDRRNTLFGDADAKDTDLIKPEEQGFKASDALVKEETRKFDERKVELEKQIAEIEHERKGKIESVTAQKDMFAEEQSKQNPELRSPEANRDYDSNQDVQTINKELERGFKVFKTFFRKKGTDKWQRAYLTSSPDLTEKKAIDSAKRQLISDSEGINIGKEHETLAQYEFKAEEVIDQSKPKELPTTKDQIEVTRGGRTWKDYPLHVYPDGRVDIDHFGRKTINPDEYTIVKKEESGLSDKELQALSEINKVTAPSKLTRNNLSQKYGETIIDKLANDRYILFGADFNKFSAVSKRGRDVAEAYDKTSGIAKAEYIRGSSINNEELRSILEKNIDYFKMVKQGAIGVKSVDFGKENELTYMDTYDQYGTKTIRYYIQPDYQLSIKKPAGNLASSKAESQKKLRTEPRTDQPEALAWDQPLPVSTNEDPAYRASDLNNAMSLRNIGRSLVQNMGKTEGEQVRTGLIKRFRRKAAGLFNPASGVIRVRNVSDIRVLSHELGHYIDQFVFDIRGLIGDKMKVLGDKYADIAQTGAIQGVKYKGRLYKTLDKIQQDVNSGRIKQVKANDLNIKLSDQIRQRDQKLEKLRGKYTDEQIAGVLQRQEMKKEIREFLKEIGYPEKTYTEGIAEFVYNYIIDPQQVIRSTPKFYAWFEKLVDNAPEIKNALGEARVMWNRYDAQDPRMKVLTLFAEKEEKTGFLDGIIKFDKNKILYSWVNHLQYMKNLSEEWRKVVGGNAVSNKDPLVSAKMMMGIDGRAQQWLLYNPYFKRGNQIELRKDVEGLVSILKPILGTAKDMDYRGYLLAKDSMESYQKRRPNQAAMPEDVARASIKLWEDQYGVQDLWDFQKKIQDYNESLLDFYVESGKMSKEVADNIKVQHEYYVPLKRVFDEYEIGGGEKAVSSKVLATSEKAVWSRHGSQKAIKDIYQSMIENTYHILAAAERNIANRNIRDAWFDIQNYNRSKKIDKAIIEEIPARQVKAYFDVATGEMRYTVSKERPKTGRILTVWENGEAHYYDIAPEHYDPIFQQEPKVGELMRILSAPSRWLQAGAVVYDPTFPVRNIVRDQQSAWFYSKHGYLPTDFIKGIASAIKKDDMFQTWLASGGDQSFLVSADKMMEKDYAKKKIGRTLDRKWEAWKKNPLIALQDFSRASEIGTRLGAFKNAYKKTNDVYKAAMESRDIAADYGIHGARVRSALGLYPFLNANIQHARMMTESMKNPASFFMKGMALTAPALMNWLLNNQDDYSTKLYQSLPAWRRTMMFNVRIPGTDHFLPLPKGFYGIFFGSSMEAFMDHAIKEDSRVAQELPRELFSSYSPIGNISEMVPFVARPLIEQWANKKGYTGKPIVSEAMQMLQPSEQFYNSTPEIYKKMGEALGWSPLRIEHYVKSYTGGAGAGAVTIADELLQTMGWVDKKPEDTFTKLSRLPVFKALLTERPIGLQSGYVSDFYEEMDKIESLNATFNNLVKTENYEKLDKLMKDPDNQRMYEFYEGNSTAINNFRQALVWIRDMGYEVMKDPALTSEQKQAEIKNMNDIVQESAVKFQKAYEDGTFFDYGKSMDEIIEKMRAEKKGTRGEILQEQSIYNPHWQNVSKESPVIFNRLKEFGGFKPLEQRVTLSREGTKPIDLNVEKSRLYNEKLTKYYAREVKSILGENPDKYSKEKSSAPLNKSKEGITKLDESFDRAWDMARLKVNNEFITQKLYEE